MTTKTKKAAIDPREVRRLRVWCSAAKHEVLLEHVDEAPFGTRTIRYPAPNSIAISLSIALASSKKARTFYDAVIARFSRCPTPTAICGQLDRSDLFDYFEQMQISVIFAFTAVESFANIAVPCDFTYERLNSKGIREVLSKDNIERWCSTSEKVGAVLPLVFGIKSPKGGTYWQDFTFLQELRNDIVHPKTKGEAGEMPTDYLKRFFEERVFSAVDSARSVINYYCVGRPSLPYFPQVIGSKGPSADLTAKRADLGEHITPVPCGGHKPNKRRQATV